MAARKQRLPMALAERGGRGLLKADRVYCPAPASRSTAIQTPLAERLHLTHELQGADG
jgi:hypothetical protein